MLQISSHRQLVEAVGQLDIDPATDKTCWDDLRDNRDLRVMDTWDPPHRFVMKSRVYEAPVRVPEIKI